MQKPSCVWKCVTFGVFQSSPYTRSKYSVGFFGPLNRRAPIVYISYPSNDSFSKYAVGQISFDFPTIS